MTDDQGKKAASTGRAGKAKGRLQRAQSIFRQFADDIQLKDLLAKAEALVANTNLTFAKAASKDTRPAEIFRDETSSNESSKKARAGKTPSRGARLKKAAPKKTKPKTLSKKKKRAPKHRRHARP